MSHGHGNQPRPPSAETIAAGHETSDATAKALVIFLIALVVTLVLIVVLSLGLFMMFNSTEDNASDAEYPGSPLAKLQSPSPAPPIQPALGDKTNPLHETLPYQDSMALNAEFVRVAGTYGNETMADHKIHDRMPVDAAIALLADSGIPANTATDIPAPQGTAHSVPTPYSDGGRGSNTDKAAAPGIPTQQKY